MSNPNTNCLAGFKCPKCGSYEPFRIEVKTMLTVSDSGGDDTESFEWEDSSYCECLECFHAATVAAFSTEQGGAL